ncbi:sulfatase-like hydrolase/transferase [Agrobacterium sp. CR_3]|uniref:sulfatase-like hydrolase/transferase n=1 Tax=Agrobacterium sp. CR_3 TaxID=3055791 RepID=UPI0035BFDEA5
MKEYRYLNLSSALLFVVVLFVGMPTLIYGPNEREFSYPFANILIEFSLPALVSLVAIALPFFIFPRGLAKIWSCLLAVCAAYGWAHGTFQTVNFGDLDAAGWTVEIRPSHAMIDAAVSIILASLVYFVAWKRPRVMTIIFFVFVLQMGWQAFSISHSYVSIHGKDLQSLGALNREKNILVVLLDTLQSDVFEAVLQNDKELRDQFDGFTLYPNTVGAAPTTYLSMPTIHSGLTFEPGTKLADFFQHAVGEQSFLSRLVDRGYESLLINPITSVCPRDVRCETAKAILGGDPTALRMEAARVFDLSIFRVAPLALKQAIYNEGAWLAQMYLFSEEFVHRAIEGNELLREMASSVAVSSSKPTVKFIHLFNTHPPYVIDDACVYLAREQPATREAIESQAHCALRNFGRLLGQMKSIGVYDNTVVAIMADHGSNYSIPSPRMPDTPFALLVGAANPTLAVKPWNAKGKINIDTRDAHIGDLARSICDITGDCIVNDGVALGRELTPRTRIYNDYKWEHDFWYLEAIPKLKRYTVSGNMFLQTSWSDAREFRRGDDIGNIGSADCPCVATGWGEPEPWGVWSTSQSSYVAIRIAREERPSALNVSMTGFVLPVALPEQIVSIYKNGKYLTEVRFTPEENDRDLSVPVEAGESIVGLEFRPSNPKSPSDLGLSIDARKLGVGIRSISLTN